jgi:hypothetical protein
MQETTDGNSLSQPYEPPTLGQDAPTRSEPLPSLLFIIIGFMFCLLCHGITTLGLFSYIDKAGGPTSKIIDSTVFGYAPIMAVPGWLCLIYCVGFHRKEFGTSPRVSMIDGRLPIPILMQQLVSEGRWPAKHSHCELQNVSPIVPPESIRCWAPGEHKLYLYPIPRVSIRTLIMGGDRFWLSEQAAPWGLDHSLAAAIGDFGLGSDAPIVLDYRQRISSPSVLRLQWGAEGNYWTTVADSFDEFAEVSGIRVATPRFDK